MDTEIDMAAEHFTAVACKYHTANRHYPGNLYYFLAKYILVLTSLCMLDFKFFDIFCVL